jgi:hypothetical protein
MAWNTHCTNCGDFIFVQHGWGEIGEGAALCSCCLDDHEVIEGDSATWIKKIHTVQDYWAEYWNIDARRSPIAGVTQVKNIVDAETILFGGHHHDHRQYAIGPQPTTNPISDCEVCWLSTK